MFLNDPKKKELVIDSLLMMSLFYIIAHKETYAVTKKLYSNTFNVNIEDEVLLHSIVFLNGRQS